MTDFKVGDLVVVYSRRDKYDKQMIFNSVHKNGPGQNLYNKICFISSIENEEETRARYSIAKVYCFEYKDFFKVAVEYYINRLDNIIKI